jgi:hypothetical protein
MMLVTPAGAVQDPEEEYLATTVRAPDALMNQLVPSEVISQDP